MGNKSHLRSSQKSARIRLRVSARSNNTLCPNRLIVTTDSKVSVRPSQLSSNDLRVPLHATTVLPLWLVQVTSICKKCLFPRWLTSRRLDKASRHVGFTPRFFALEQVALTPNSILKYMLVLFIEGELASHGVINVRWASVIFNWIRMLCVRATFFVWFDVVALIPRLRYFFF